MKPRGIAGLVSIEAWGPGVSESLLPPSPLTAPQHPLVISAKFQVDSLKGQDLWAWGEELSWLKALAFWPQFPHLQGGISQSLLSLVMVPHFSLTLLKLPTFPPVFGPDYIGWGVCQGAVIFWGLKVPWPQIRRMIRANIECCVLSHSYLSYLMCTKTYKVDVMAIIFILQG